MHTTTTTTTTTVLRPFVRDYPGEPVPEETLTHPPFLSSCSLCQLLPSTMIHSILLVQITCLAIFLYNLSPRSLWSTSWSGALHLIFHAFLHPISIFFSQHMPILNATCFAVISRSYRLFLVQVDLYNGHKKSCVCVNFPFLFSAGYPLPF